MRRICLMLVLLCAAGSAAAQEEGSGSSVGVSSTMAQLLSQGYEIKAAAPNGKKYVVFLQMNKTAYACEFVTVSKTRCWTIN